MSRKAVLQDLASIEKGLARPLGSWQMSPNDLLVQIALPLVLILAIIIQLMQLQVQRAEAEESFLEPWKQQLILRLDEVFAAWERDSGLNRYDLPSTINFDGRFPSDPGFSRLSEAAEGLGSPARMESSLYLRALQYDPVAAGAPPEVIENFRPMYDPAVPLSGSPEGVEEQFIMTAEKRAFAEQYIQERMDQWRSEIERLQWSVVNHVVGTLTIDDPLSDANSAVQLSRIAEALKERGYPLLPSVLNEYSDQ